MNHRDLRSWSLRLLVFLMVCVPALATAEVSVSSLFSDHMVVQRDQPIVVWGNAEAGEKVYVVMGGHTAETTTSEEGRWKVSLPELSAGGPHRLVIEGAGSRIQIDDVLVGEVWVCSGQSNMQWPINASYDDDLARLAAHHENLRIITVPNVASQEPADDFQGSWQIASPETIGGFSAVGYQFGLQLHRSLQVPVGLIDNAWGGSAAEAWVPREVLARHERYAGLLERWDRMAAEAEADPEAAKKHARALRGNHRPANLYQGVLHPLIGYGIRGAIWYQGESNAGRAYQYRHLFPLMIQTWREAWGQGDFPFYWVQLADFRGYVDRPGNSAWAELREAQTMTMSKLPNTGEAVIIDLGEAKDIHPRNKRDVGLRLARWALARDYGKDLAHRSPTLKSSEFRDGKAILTFDHVGKGLVTFDIREAEGFAIAGEDQTFHEAKAKITSKNTIEVWSEAVEKPVAVRYAWADNPVCNVESREGLPLTPFRTDSWKGVTEGREN